MDSSIFGFLFGGHDFIEPLHYFINTCKHLCQPIDKTRIKTYNPYVSVISDGVYFSVSLQPIGGVQHERKSYCQSHLVHA